MNLRYIVPALGLLASTSGALFAENLGGLSVGGFVNTTGTVSDTEEDGSGSQKHFASAVELRLAYKIGDQVTAQVDMEWNNDSASDTDLEQAYVNYAVTDKVSLTAGKFTTYSGWTAADADGLYRINASPITGLYTSDLIGGVINFTPMPDLTISGFLVNGLFAQGGSDTAYNDSNNKSLAAAIDAAYTLTDVGTFNLEAGWDQGSSDRTAISIGANATIKLASYEPLTIGAELMFDMFENDATNTDGNAIGFLVMGNHTLPNTPFPMSVTGMVTIVQAEAGSDVDLGAGVSDDSSSTELAIALLTSPTGDSRFGANAELAYEIVSSDAAGSDDIKSIAFAIEGIAIIP